MKRKTSTMITVDMNTAMLVRPVIPKKKSLGSFLYKIKII